MDDLKQLEAEVNAERQAGSVTLADRIALVQAVQLARIADALEQVLELAKTSNH